MNRNPNDDELDIDAYLRIDRGIAEDERSLVLASLQPLAGLLMSLDRRSLRIESWVKNRGERGQVTYTSVRAKDTDVVADDDSMDLREAMAGVRKDLKRQLIDLHDRRTNRRH